MGFILKNKQIIRINY